MKNVLVDMLKNKGFTEGKLEGISCEHSFLTLSLEKDVEVAWFGTRSTSLKVDVFVNLASGICRVDFYKGSSRAYKTRWYDLRFLRQKSLDKGWRRGYNTFGWKQRDKFIAGRLAQLV